MNNIVLIMCMVSVGLSAQVPVALDERDKEGRVFVEALTAGGERLASGVKIKIMQGGRVIRTLDDERIFDLPYGSYHIEARATGAYPISTTLAVRSTRQILPLCFFVAPIESPEPEALVRGQISRDSREGDCLWVRLLSPFSAGVFHDTRASADGFFAIENVRPGKYLALTIGPRGICESTELMVLYGPTYTLDLKVNWKSFQK
jgi:hypothetical protein